MSTRHEQHTCVFLLTDFEMFLPTREIVFTGDISFTEVAKRLLQINLHRYRTYNSVMGSHLLECQTSAFGVEASKDSSCFRNIPQKSVIAA